MKSDVLLVGPLAALSGLFGVAGSGQKLHGRLTGGARAGLERGSWPVFTDNKGEVMAMRVRMTPALARYAEVMGLQYQDHQGLPVLGVQRNDSGAYEWQAAGWPADLAAEIAALILEQPAGTAADQIAQRLPMIGVWAASRIRARLGPVSGGDLVSVRTPDDVRMRDDKQLYTGFFSAVEWRISHRKHAGGFTPEAAREAFTMGDAVVVLPWDPRRDRVLLIEQFRVGPAVRHDPQPWMLEAIAGRIDTGETAAEAARREAMEEANLQLQDLIPAPDYYPSPGAVTEYLYNFIGIADLPDGIAGIYGLDAEAEDIRGHLVDRAEVMRMVDAGEISNGPLALLVLWLAVRADELRVRMGLS